MNKRWLSGSCLKFTYLCSYPYSPQCQIVLCLRAGTALLSLEYREENRDGVAETSGECNLLRNAQCSISGGVSVWTCTCHSSWVRLPARDLSRWIGWILFLSIDSSFKASGFAFVHSMLISDLDSIGKTTDTLFGEENGRRATPGWYSKKYSTFPQVLNDHS